MTRVALSLGANLGDRVAALQHAVDVLSGLGEIVGLSDVYRDRSCGGRSNRSITTPWSSWRRTHLLSRYWPQPTVPNRAKDRTREVPLGSAHP